MGWLIFVSFALNGQSTNKIDSLKRVIINHQQETLKLNSQMIDKNRVLIMSAFGIVILLALLLYMLFRNNLKNKRLSEELELKVAERTSVKTSKFCNIFCLKI